MPTRNRFSLLLIGLLLVLPQVWAEDLAACLSKAITNEVYLSPTPAELGQARQLFLHTLQGHEPDEELKAGWAALGFNLQEITTTKETLWLLSEPVGTEAGRGWYLFRRNPQSSLAVQAPHARNDVDTGLIGLRLFLAGNARLLAASTITRHKADAAHLDNTFFHSCTLAFAQACPTGLIVQLHGFDIRKHPDLKADVVASAATVSPEPWLTALARQLEAATALRVLTYPRETRQLGGTLNSQAHALRQTSGCRFLHLEMSRELRKRLTQEETLGGAMLACVTAIKTQ